VEGVELRLRGKHPTTIPVDRLGVPNYDELVFVANENDVEKRRDDLRLFIGAVAKGARQARKDPRRATALLLRASKDLKPKLVRESVRVTLPALFPKGSGKPWGYLDSQEWRAYGAWMFGHGLLKERPDVSKAFTNELLPGEGL
jgi:putative hydroxymethylpyrimidine transport system substrate-binding protein